MANFSNEFVQTDKHANPGSCCTISPVEIQTYGVSIKNKVISVAMWEPNL